MHTSCLVGSQGSQIKALNASLSENTLASLLSHSPAKQFRFFHLCLQVDMYICLGQGLNLGKCCVPPRAHSYDQAPLDICHDPSLSEL